MRLIHAKLNKFSCISVIYVYVFTVISHFLSVAYQQTSFTNVLFACILFCGIITYYLLVTVSSATALSYKFFVTVELTMPTCFSFVHKISRMSCIMLMIMSPNIIICIKMQNICNVL